MTPRASSHSSGTAGSIRSSPSSTANGASPTSGSATATACPRPSASSWSANRTSGSVARRTAVERVELASRLELGFERRVRREMIAERVLARAEHDDHVLEAGGERLFDDQLDRRRVHDRQQTLRCVPSSQAGSASPGPPPGSPRCGPSWRPSLAWGRRYTCPAMPTYEYRCRDCGHSFDIVQKMSDDPLTHCPECGGELRKVFAPPAISFKGSGFYATDHGKKAQAVRRREDEATGTGDSRNEGRAPQREGGTAKSRDGDAEGRRRTRISSEEGVLSDRRVVHHDEEGGVFVSSAEIGVFGGSGFYAFLEDPRGGDGRDAVRAAERADDDRHDRRAARGVPAAPRQGPRVPAAPRALPRERLGDEGARA